MNTYEFKKLKVGSYVAIIKTGEKAVVTAIIRERGMVQVCFRHTWRKDKEWKRFHYIELGKI